MTIVKGADPRAVDRFIAKLPQPRRDIRAAEFTRWVKRAVALNAVPQSGSTSSIRRRG